MPAPSAASATRSPPGSPRSSSSSSGDNEYTAADGRRYHSLYREKKEELAEATKESSQKILSLENDLNEAFAAADCKVIRLSFSGHRL